MRTPQQIAADRTRPGTRTMTGAPLTSEGHRGRLSAGGNSALNDTLVTWSGSTPTITKLFRFGNATSRGFGEGGLA